MEDKYILRLRLPEGQTLGSCDPKIKEAVSTLVDLKAASLCKFGAPVEPMSLPRATVCGGDSAPALAASAEDEPEIQRKVEAIARRLDAHGRDPDRNPVMKKLADEYSDIIAATFVCDPGSALRMWRLLYSILKSTDATDLTAEIEAMRNKFFTRDQALVLLGCVEELGGGGNYVEQFIASSSLRAFHARFTSELARIEGEFVDSLTGMNIDDVEF